jgi:TatD DNase family protein
MMYVDTHIHLYDEQFDADRDTLIAKAMHNGIRRFYMPNVDATTIDPMMRVAEQYPEQCKPMMGLHPCSVGPDVTEILALYRRHLEERRFAAVGEIGIDLHWDKTHIKEQELAFRIQVDWALEFDYPIVIHSRKSLNEIIAILKTFPKKPRGIFHCFSGSIEEAKSILALGEFKLGIGGVATYKNSGLLPVIQETGLDHLVLETDAPYLAPVPFRGKRNEPSHMMEVVRTLSLAFDLPADEIGRITTRNAEAVFGGS